MKKKWWNYLFVLFMLAVGVIKYDEKHPIANPFAKLKPIKGIDTKSVTPKIYHGLGFRRDWIGDDTTNLSTSQYRRMSWAE